MLGVILIFIWGPPQPSFDEGIAVALDSGTVLRDGTKATDLEETALRQKRWHRAMSAIGLGFIFLGFAVQLWAVWV